MGPSAFTRRGATCDSTIGSWVSHPGGVNMNGTGICRCVTHRSSRRSAMRRPDEWVSRDVAERSKPVLAILQVSCVSAGFTANQAGSCKPGFGVAQAAGKETLCFWILEHGMQAHAALRDLGFSREGEMKTSLDLLSGARADSPPLRGRGLLSSRGWRGDFGFSRFRRATRLQTCPMSYKTRCNGLEHPEQL